jgi:hypothetical protein
VRISEKLMEISYLADNKLKGVTTMANEMRDRLVEMIKQAKQSTKNANCDIERNMLFADCLIENDVVPVVRCKDCKHFEIDEEDELGECKCGYITVSYNGALYPQRNDYCSYGERRSNDD